MYFFFKELRSKSADLFKETRLYRHFKEDLNKKAAWGTAGVGGAQSGTGRRWGWGSDDEPFFKIRAPTRTHARADAPNVIARAVRAHCNACA